MKHKKQELPIEETPETQNDQRTDLTADISEQTIEDGAYNQDVDQADTQIVELTNDLQRTRADFENFRKQVDLQRAQVIALTKAETVEKFLSLIDDFDRALQAYPEQLEPLRKNFEKTLQSLSLQKINSEPNTEFNPDFHEAVSVEEGDGEVEVVAETLRPGYLYDGDVIRAAMVKVKRA